MKKKKEKSIVSFPGKKKKDAPKRLLLQVGLLGLFLLVLTMGIYAWQFWTLKIEMSDYSKDVDRLQEKNRKLREEIVLLQDEEYIEFLASRHLGLTRPDDDTGEEDYRVADDYYSEATNE